MKLPHNLICIDIETTCSDEEKGSIIQLSAARVKQNFTHVLGDSFNLYVKPLDSYRNPEAMAVNKISEEILSTAYTLHDALDLFESFCEDDNILAAWGNYFDVVFLRKQYEKIYREYPFSHRSMDLKSIAIWEMAKRNKPMTSGVSKFLKELGRPFVGEQHNAIDDISNTINILKEFI